MCPSTIIPSLPSRESCERVRRLRGDVIFIECSHGRHSARYIRFDRGKVIVMHFRGRKVADDSHVPQAMGTLDICQKASRFARVKPRLFHMSRSRRSACRTRPRPTHLSPRVNGKVHAAFGVRRMLYTHGHERSVLRDQHPILRGVRVCDTSFDPSVTECMLKYADN